MAATFNHYGLPVSDLDGSVAFYERWTSMTVSDRGDAGGVKAARLSDSGRGFVLSLFEMPAARFPRPMPMLAHLGMSCGSRDEVDQVAQQAENEGILIVGPAETDDGLGYQAIVADPDGYIVEFAHGQRFGVA